MQCDHKSEQVRLFVAIKFPCKHGGNSSEFENKTCASLLMDQWSFSIDIGVSWCKAWRKGRGGRAHLFVMDISRSLVDLIAGVWEYDSIN